jgi:hypothetical protein
MVQVWWEGAARSLDARLPYAIEGTGPLIATMRDTVSLSAVLPAAVLMLSDSTDAAPVLCQHIRRWGIACEQLRDTDELVEIERDGILRLLIQAGLAKFIWAGMGLCVLHLLVATPGRFARADDRLADETDDVLALPDTGEIPPAPWDGSCAFWYRLMPNRRHDD